MALTKAKTDLVGSESAGTITWQSVNAATAFPSTLARRDVTGKIGLAFIFRAKYGASAPTTRPKLEIFIAPLDGLGIQDTEPYESVELDYANSVEKQVTLPLRFAEDLMWVSWKVTNGATNAAEFYVAIVETNL
jgi:hypothetical protein